MKAKAGYINIKEASQLVGVHPDTIRRLVKDHRGSINIMQGKGTKAPYYINSDWLKSLYGLDEPHTAPTTGDNQPVDKEPSPDTNKAISGVIEALTAQLEAKDKQLATAQATIDKLAGDYSTLLNQSQQLQGLLLPANSSKQAKTQTAPAAPQKNHKAAKPQSRRKKATKQAKNKPSKSVKPEEKKRWWRRG